MKARVIALAVFLLAFGAFYRVFRLEVLPALPNFAPVMAIAFCGALVLPGRLAWAVPLGSLLATDFLLNAHYGEPLFSWDMLATYLCYFWAVAAGYLLRGRNLAVLFGATAANALVFYFVTNAAAWFHNPHYPQILAGLWQSLTVGRPGFAPSWVFFRNSLAGDFLFTALFLGAFYLARNRKTEPSLCRQESSS